MGMWDDDDNASDFRDVPEEAVNPKLRQQDPTSLQQQLIPQSAPVQSYRPSNIPAEPVVTNPVQQPFNSATGFAPEPQYNVDSVVEELGEEDYTEVLNDANLRIEQGRLYQMIMNHDLFEGMDADPRAVENVQREIRKYARERMEIMLGMRQEKAPEQVVVSDFNSLEVQILKMVASKASNGATERPEADEIAEAVQQAPKRQTLKPLGGSTGHKPQVQPKIAQKAQVQPKNPTSGQSLPKTASAPVPRKANPVIDQILAEEGLSREDLAAMELDYKGMGKPFEALTDQEKAERIAQYNQRAKRHKTVKSPQALPMATPEQQEMLAVQRAQQIGSAPGMSALLQKVASMPAKNS